MSLKKALGKVLKEEKYPNPCQDGYKMVGTKMKDGREVPNCVPKNELSEGDAPEEIYEAEYQGSKVTLNQPTQGDVKKYKVYVTHPDTGNVVKVNFGDKNMEIKRDDPEAKKSFRARHKCSEKTFAKDRHKAGYWSCKLWGNKPVSDIVN